MKKQRQNASSNMRKYYQLILVVVCCVSVVSLLIYRHEYYRLRYVLEVLNFFGKPGLSEIEFCGAGFNATLLTETLSNSMHAAKETPPLFQQIDENFYTYSSFVRRNDKFDTLTPAFVFETDTIAIGKSKIDPNFRCNVWIDDVSKPKPAKFSYKIIFNGDMDYTVYIFHCSVSKDLGHPIAISFYANDYNVNPIESPISQLIPINTKIKRRDSKKIKFVNIVDIAACVVPNQVPITFKTSLMEFLTFHQMMGVDQFTVYDSTITEDVIQRVSMLPDDISKWKIKFFPLNYPFIFNKSYKTVRAAVQLDCIFRNLQIDKEVYTRISHLITLSWDEFVVPRYHHSLKALLQEFNPTQKQKKIDVSCLNFCSNQDDDSKITFDYPDFAKKTSYYKIPNKVDTVTIVNLDMINTHDDIANAFTDNRTMPDDVLAVHKYSYCNDGKSYNTNSEKLSVYPHKFEGAMLKFADDFVNNKLYRLFRTGRIWENSSENVHEGL